MELLAAWCSVLKIFLPIISSTRLWIHQRLFNEKASKVAQEVHKPKMSGAWGGGLRRCQYMLTLFLWLFLGLLHCSWPLENGLQLPLDSSNHSHKCSAKKKNTFKLCTLVLSSTLISSPQLWVLLPMFSLAVSGQVQQRTTNWSHVGQDAKNCFSPVQWRSRTCP